MQATLSSSSVSSYIYKMDNVLYEVKDKRGILKNNNYEAWKQEVIDDLAGSGFITLKNDKYVITKEGREVIKHDSFLNYNRRINLENNIEETAAPVERTGITRNQYFIAILSLLVLAVITIFRLK